MLWNSLCKQIWQLKSRQIFGKYNLPNQLRKNQIYIYYRIFFFLTKSSEKETPGPDDFTGELH